MANLVAWRSAKFKQLSATSVQGTMITPKNKPLPAGGGFYTAPVTNLSRMQLRELKGTIDGALRRKGSDLDPYSEAHLAEASSLIDRALNAQYLYNTDDIAGGGGGSMFPFMGQPATEDNSN